MIAFKDLPIRRKVQGVIMLTSVTALILTVAAFVVYDLLNYRQEMVHNLSTTASILAVHTHGALVHHDQAEAQDLLIALRSDPYLAAAALYDARGQLFAHYPADEPLASFPTKPGPAGSVLEQGHALVYQPVTDGQKLVGTLYLRSALRPLSVRLQFYGGVALLVLCGSVMFALALSNVLERRISDPIQALAQTAKAVAERKDVSVRANRSSADELGLLTESFNQMLAQLQEAEQTRSFLANIVESSDVAVIGKDFSGRVVSWNAAAERMYGWSATEMIGQPITRLIPAERAGEQLKIVEEARRGELRTYETIRVRKDGRSIDVSLTVSPIKNARGEIIGASSVARDISEYKRAEEQIRRLNAELERRVRERTAELTESVHEMEAFTYSVAHDLRAPLRHLDAFSKILVDDFSSNLPPEALRYLGNVRRGSRHMSRLVDDLLNLARVGRQELSRQPVALNSIVEEVVGELQAEWQDRHIEWHIQQLPTVECDAGLMKLVFSNLLSNAIKYTRPRPAAVIEVGCLQTDGVPEFFVRDNGVGFNMKYVNKLFGVFQRLHRADEFEGTGVGLATVDRIVRKHGGRVWAESPSGQGAIFRFTLTAAKTDEGDPQI